MFSQWLSTDQDELFHFVSGPYDQQQKMQKNEPFVSPASGSEDTNNGEKKPRRGRGRKKATTGFENTDESPAEHLRKLMHRDVERQRRQDMAILYQSLRSLLPSEFLQGKRSISNHIHGTIRYIRYMQEKTDELKRKRERLKNLLNPSSSEAVLSCPETSDIQTKIAVKPCRAGMEVNVSTALKGGLPLSGVIKVLVLEGMSVISCISTQVHKTLLHTIETEVNEGRSVDQNELQRILMALVLHQ